MATSKDSGNKSGGSAGNAQKSGAAPAKRGFAAMDENQQREIASKGSQAAHQKGTAHEFDSEEARRSQAKKAARLSAATANTWPTSAARGRKPPVGRPQQQGRCLSNAKGSRQGGKEE
ncbi:hypothetical protein LP420_04770 [Massilia sp. B-10]|nr:hypothetical protein LP420_04770 [Massilia sp. B-10]